MSLSSPPPRKPEDNAWMTTYADIITLLLAFFVILFSMSTLKKEFFNQLTEEMVEGQKRGFAQKIQTFRADTIPEESPVLYRVFIPTLEEHNYLKSVIGIQEDNEVSKSQLIFPEESLFIPNTIKLTNKAKLILRDTATYLNQLDDSYFDISIQSHYEKKGSIPNYSDKFQFTAERALVIRSMLKRQGYTKDNIYIIGYGDSQPLQKVNFKSDNPQRRIIFSIHRKNEIEN